MLRKNIKRKGKASGGILVYYKKELKNILTFLEKSSENTLWIEKFYTCRQGGLPSRSI